MHNLPLTLLLSQPWRLFGHRLEDANEKQDWDCVEVPNVVTTLIAIPPTGATNVSVRWREPPGSDMLPA